MFVHVCIVLDDFSGMFSEKCSIEDFALWIDSIMDNCLKVGLPVCMHAWASPGICDDRHVCVINH